MVMMVDVQLKTFFWCIFSRKIQRKSPNHHTLISLVLKYFHLENTEAHEILRSEHYAKRWPLEPVGYHERKLSVFTWMSALSSWPQCGEKRGHLYAGIKCYWDSDRCVSAGARIPGQRCVEDKGSLAFASLWDWTGIRGRDWDVIRKANLCFVFFLDYKDPTQLLAISQIGH